MWGGGRIQERGNKRESETGRQTGRHTKKLPAGELDVEKIVRHTLKPAFSGRA